MCRIRSRQLEAHHIVPIARAPELKVELSNGITLCRPCHGSIKGKEADYETQFFEITKGRNPNGKQQGSSQGQLDAILEDLAPA